MTDFGRLPTDTYGNGGFSPAPGLKVRWFSPDENTEQNARLILAAEDSASVVNVPIASAREVIDGLELMLRNAVDTGKAIKGLPLY